MPEKTSDPEGAEEEREWNPTDLGGQRNWLGRSSLQDQLFLKASITQAYGDQQEVSDKSAGAPYWLPTSPEKRHQALCFLTASRQKADLKT